MGRYMKKGKITGDVAVMEVPQSALGVRTRAKTLALQQNSEVCYLQLRSRRLEKPQFPPPSPLTNSEKQEKSKQGCKQRNRSGSHQNQSRRAGSRLGVESVSSGGPAGSASFSHSKHSEVKVEEEEMEGCFHKFGSASTTPTNRKRGDGFQTDEVDDLGVEAVFGENNLEFDGTEWSTRERTPCSLIRDLGSNEVPGLAMRSMHSGAMSRRRVQDSVQRSIALTREMEDFFAAAERQQRKQFMDKYNFDVLNDLPLLGRYEWVRVDP